MRNALAWLGLVLAGSCSRAPATAPVASESEPPPILVVGLDGFEWNVALPLLRAGRMPHLAQLWARGVAGGGKTATPAGGAPTSSGSSPSMGGPTSTPAAANSADSIGKSRAVR